MTKPLTSLSIFFPFFNDAGTVREAISEAYRIGNSLTNNLEVIALHGGASKDETWKEIQKQKQVHPTLKIVDKKDNKEGYAVIKYGLSAALNDWVFYTDGDLQYSVDDLPKLVQLQKETGADVVNGYKKTRGDSVIRTALGKGYQLVSTFIFKLPIRDTDCDFRLIRRSFLKKITLVSTNSSILPELIKKLQKNDATFTEMPVSHSERSYGSSNYSSFSLLREKIAGDLSLWWHLKHTKIL